MAVKIDKKIKGYAVVTPEDKAKEAAKAVAPVSTVAELPTADVIQMHERIERPEILVGSTYEQGFIRFNNYYKVYTQAAPEFRQFPTDLMKLSVKNEAGEMVPYSAFMTIKKTQGPNEITRYNLYNSAAIRGGSAEGYTSSDAIRAVREVAAKTLPKGYDIAWEGLSFDAVIENSREQFEREESAVAV